MSIINEPNEYVSTLDVELSPPTGDSPLVPAVDNSEKEGCYTPKSERDNFYKWFINTYQLQLYTLGKNKLPQAEYIQQQYKNATGRSVSLVNVRSIVKFYKMYTLLIPLCKQH